MSWPTGPKSNTTRERSERPSAAFFLYSKASDSWGGGSGPGPPQKFNHFDGVFRCHVNGIIEGLFRIRSLEHHTMCWSMTDSAPYGRAASSAYRSTRLLCTIVCGFQVDFEVFCVQPRLREVF